MLRRLHAWRMLWFAYSRRCPMRSFRSANSIVRSLFVVVAFALGIATDARAAVPLRPQIHVRDT